MEYTVFKMKFLLVITFQCLIISATSFDMDIKDENPLEYVFTKIFEGVDISDYDAMIEEVHQHALDLLDAFFALVEDEDLELDQNLKEKFIQEFSEEKLHSFVEGVFGIESAVASQIKKANSSAIRDRTLELLEIFLGEDSPTRRKRAFEDNPNDNTAGLIKGLFQGFQAFQGGKKEDDERDLKETKKGLGFQDLIDTNNQNEGSELEAGIKARPRGDTSASTEKRRNRNRNRGPTTNEGDVDDSGKKASTFMDKVKEFSDLVYGTADELMGLVQEKNKKMSNYGEKEMEQGKNTMKKYRNDFSKFLKNYSNDLVDLIKRFNSKMADIAG